ncbi:MAG: hypothetical protein IJR89_02740 [Clostridia bacterium]|nr:hypothetical protein [Clostridia bacterium]
MDFISPSEKRSISSEGIARRFHRANGAISFFPRPADFSFFAKVEKRTKRTDAGVAERIFVLVTDRREIHVKGSEIRFAYRLPKAIFRKNASRKVRKNG